MSESFVESNRELLWRVPLSTVDGGEPLVMAYDLALGIDPTLAQTEIVPLAEDANPSVIAAASPSWLLGNESGHHQVFLRLDGTYSALRKAMSVIVVLPKARVIFAERRGLHLDELTPEMVYVSDALHELGHTSLYNQFMGRIQEYRERRKREMDAMPLGAVATSRFLKAGAPEAAWLQDNFSYFAAKYNVSSSTELLEMQFEAYRDLFHESWADRFAARVTSVMSPQLRSLLVLPS